MVGWIGAGALLLRSVPVAMGRTAPVQSTLSAQALHLLSNLPVAAVVQPAAVSDIILSAADFFATTAATAAVCETKQLKIKLLSVLCLHVNCCFVFFLLSWQ